MVPPSFQKNSNQDDELTAILKQATAGWAFLGGFLSISFLILIVTLIMGLQWPDLPVHFSYVLIGVVTLLSIEWLTRKLLKLA